MDRNASGGEREREVYSHTVRVVHKRKCSDRQGAEELTQGCEPSRAGIRTPVLWGIREVVPGFVFVHVCIYSKYKCMYIYGF